MESISVLVTVAGVQLLGINPLIHISYCFHTHTCAHKYIKVCVMLAFKLIIIVRI